MKRIVSLLLVLCLTLSLSFAFADEAYEPVTITFSDNWDSIAMNGNSTTLIDGFQGGLSLMKWSKQKATIIFISALGYTSSGSGNIIPPYAPLIFDLELLDNN